MSWSVFLGQQNHGSRDPQGGARLGAGKKTDLAIVLAARRYKETTVSEALGVARSNVIERRYGNKPRRGSPISAHSPDQRRMSARVSAGLAPPQSAKCQISVPDSNERVLNQKKW